MGPGGIGNANSESQSAATTINTFVEGALSCSDFPTSLDGAPELGKHQKEARAVSQDWKSTVRIRIYNSNTLLIAQSSKFLNIYKTLYSLADDLGDDAINAQFIQGLQILEKGVNDAVDDSTDALDVMQKFDNSLNIVVQTISTDRESIRAIYEGEEGVLVRLEEELHSAENARATNIIIISSGAAGVIVGGLMIVAGVLLAIPSGGVTATLIFGGAIFVGGGSVAMGIAAEDLKKQNKVIQEKTTEISYLTANIALLASVSEDLNLLGAQGREAARAMDFLLSQWQVLVNELNQLKKDVEDADPEYGVFVKAFLDIAKDQWEDVDETAHLIKDQLIGIPVDMEPPGGKRVSASLTSLAGTERELLPKYVKYGSRVPISMDAATSSQGVFANLQAMLKSLGRLSSVLREQPVGVIAGKNVMHRVTRVVGGLAAASTSISQPIRTMAAEILPKLERLVSENFSADKMPAMRDDLKNLVATLISIISDAKKSHKNTKAFVTTCGQAVAEITSEILSYKSEDATMSKTLARLRERTLSANKALGRGRKQWYELATGISAETMIDSMVEQAHEAIVQSKELKKVGKGSDLGKVISSVRDAHKWVCSVTSEVSSLHDEMGAFINVLRSLIFELDLLSQKVPDRLLRIWAEKQVVPVMNNLKMMVEV